ncbi:MAG: trehalase family glycosidase [Anaerolineaceae bacterium]|nr:trehalase family glycosidase [Anaerolineaceae bacterium]
MTDIHLPQPFSHDLSLPAWGPYSKKYNGISHIPDIARGIRFDLSVFPGYYRHRVNVPHTQWESGYHPWEAAPGLDFFSYRYDLEWKDQVYCDVAFFPWSGDEKSARLVRCEFVNNTSQVQHTVLHYMAYLDFPPLRAYSEEAVIPADMHLPPGAIWIDALDYNDLQYATTRPSDTLVYEGWLRGEVRNHGFVNGTGIGENFGVEAGDKVCYSRSIQDALADGLMLVRYRAAAKQVAFTTYGLPNPVLTFAQSEDFALVPIALGAVPAGDFTFELISQGGAALELDGFVLLEAGKQGQVHFSPHRWNPMPASQSGPKQNTLLLEYLETPVTYGLAWGGKYSEVRQFFSSEIDRSLPYYVTDHVKKVITTDGGGHFTNIFIRPVIVESHSQVVLYGLVCQGEEARVREMLRDFDPNSHDLEIAYHNARKMVVNLPTNPSGQTYLFSLERMAATLLTNVIYPLYTQRSYIRHFTPGKRWDCLYTWDSGFISLGLLHIDLTRAIDCLNAYTTPPGDTQAAFLHHGSPVPVQIYAFQELWNRTQSRELLEYFYPRLRQFYLFLAGRLGSSTTRSLQSNLLKTWDYFYNSAGWDDYPPQVFVHQNQLENRTTPVVTTAHAIRTAKILQQAARALHLPEDDDDYQTDIDAFTSALQRYAWDADAAVFSYVIHDASGHPAQILRHENGENFNLGLDGISPLFAGICNPEQEQRMIERMTSSAHMWSPIGLVSVDQNASYYRTDGYWNGAVWFPYQWFLWKALLDLGHGDLALQMAHTALELWKNEVEETYHCFEHFIVASGRGSGWHQCGGLSTPVLAWFNAYHQPGTLTCGFDTWIDSLTIPEDQSSLQAFLQHAAGEQPWLAIAVLDADRTYTLEWNGTPIEPRLRFPGVMEILLTGSGLLQIRSV